jgi:hypothetical protein
MQVRKSLFVALGVVLLFGGSYVGKRASEKLGLGPQFVADGTDPMPKPPRGGQIVAEEAAAGVLVADGTDPMPKPRGGKIVAEEVAAGVLVADGTDPMPLPKPTRGLQS